MKPCLTLIVLIPVFCFSVVHAQSLRERNTEGPFTSENQANASKASKQDSAVVSHTVELDGAPVQRVIFHEPSGKPFDLSEGDEITTWIRKNINHPSDSEKTGPLLFIVKYPDEEKRMPILMNGQPNSLVIHDSAGGGIKAFVENLYQLSGYAIEMTVSRRNREKQPNKTRIKAENKPLFGGASRRMKETTVFRLRLRAAPSTDAPILMHLSKGTICESIGEKDGWIQVRLPEGETGWLSIQYVRDAR